MKITQFDNIKKTKILFNMKTFYKIYFLLSVFALSFFGAYSQTFEDFKKKQNQELQKFKDQQEKEIAELSKGFDNYIDKADKEFTEFLKKHWEEFEVFKGLEIPELPKPKKIPAFNARTSPELIPSKVLTSIPETEKDIEIRKKPKLPLIQKTESPNFDKIDDNINFYETNINFEFDRDLNIPAPNDINEKTISEWWDKAGKTNYNFLINQLLKQKNDFSLNDWAYYKLLQKVAENISTSKNQSNLLHWFLLLRSGYKARVAFTGEKIVLLIPTKNQIFGKNFLTVNNERYYIMDASLTSSVYTYEGNLGEAGRLIDFNIYQPLNFGNEIKSKIINFSLGEKDHHLDIKFNKNIILFYQDYPIVDINVYFNAVLSRDLKESIAEGLLPFIVDKNTEESIGFLLNFVQTSFEYKTDQEQFGKEKFFFPEEVFYYPFSDCEDRSVLFSYLVKELLNLEVVGLEYSGHIATAVHLPTAVNGDYIVYNNKKYVIADPTYINAPLGLTMPKYKNMKAKIIETDNVFYLTSETEKFWKLANQSGGYRGSNLQDAVFDPKGNCFLTGYFIGEANFENIQLNSNSENRNFFIAKYDKKGKVLWADNFLGNNISTGFSIILNNENNPVIAGSFGGEIISNQNSIKSNSENEDVFIASFSADGQSLWLNKAGLDTINQTNYFNYVAQFGKKGRHLKTKLFFENLEETSNGIFSENDLFLVMGSLNNTTGLNVEHSSFAEGGDFNTIDYLYSTNEELLNQNVNKGIAGLFAIINLIKSGGMIIPGKDAQEALDKYNSDFRNKSPEIYENIGKVNALKNAEGIITIFTNNNKDVSFDKIKITNKSRIKITSLQDGNEQIDIVSGIKVGKLWFWRNLNYVKLFRITGDMLFDYSSDHTQSLMNIEDDILD